MHVLTIIGLVLEAGTIVTDRFIHPISHRLAILLYLIAVIMIVAGMILHK